MWYSTWPQPCLSLSLLHAMWHTDDSLGSECTRLVPTLLSLPRLFPFLECSFLQRFLLPKGLSLPSVWDWSEQGPHFSCACHGIILAKWMNGWTLVIRSGEGRWENCLEVASIGAITDKTSVEVMKVMSHFYSMWNVSTGSCLSGVNPSSAYVAIQTAPSIASGPFYYLDNNQYEFCIINKTIFSLEIQPCSLLLGRRCLTYLSGTLLGRKYDKEDISSAAL